MTKPTRQIMRTVTRSAAAALAIGGTGAASGCLNRPIQPIQPLTTSVVVEALTQSGVNKIDLVLAVDNSASMADKQAVLALAVPDLINGLVNPKCLDNTTHNPIAAQPAGPEEACPTGSTRDFPPVLDIHIGLISSSLGTFGATGCAAQVNSGCPANPLDDQGHLVTRSEPCGMKPPVPTFQNEGFLAWNPQSGAPAGSITEVGGIGQGGLIGSVHDLVVGNGQTGCGFESQDEAWYRFLIDPEPYGAIALEKGGDAVMSGKDTVVLQQRAQFLRPDSLLAIIVLSDETDTSLKEFSGYPQFANGAQFRPASDQCRTNGPADPCCYSCGSSPPKGCTPAANCQLTPKDIADDNPALHAFGLIDHKQNYGVEFFYPPSRYVNALQAPRIADASGTMHPNPIFTNSTSTGATRDPSLVFYAAIVGVPWQLIARKNPSGVPDLTHGVDDIPGSGQSGGFKTAAELSEPDGTKAMCGTGSAAHLCTFWDDIAGDPERYVKARSPFMVESSLPRTGTDPITGVATSPVGTTNGAGSKAGVTSTSKGEPVVINDHEWAVPFLPSNATPPVPATAYGDIQYACIFSLGGSCTTNADCPEGVTCIGGVCGKDESASGAFAGQGDCFENPPNKPVCSPNPNDSMNNTLQTSAKAYPGIKELAIAQGMGSQGIAASICPAQLTNPANDDYGYRPAVASIIDRLKQALHGECLPRQLTESTAPGPTQGQVPCLVLEGTQVDDPATECGCSGTARKPVESDQQELVTQAEQDPTAQKNHLNCFCEITQLTGSALQSCQTQAASQEDGWCYIDSSVNASQAKLVEAANCQSDNPHNIRFLGAGNAVSGSTLFITCSGD